MTENKQIELDKFTVIVRGGGDLATGISWRLYHCGFKVLVTEVAQPLSIRRKVSFSEAVYEGWTVVEGVEARLIEDTRKAPLLWNKGIVPVMVDPTCKSRETLKPDVVVDAIMAKKNLGTSINHAPLVIAIGPGFETGKDAHYVVETKRGHYLGRLIVKGSAAPDTGTPGKIMGYGSERVIRAPIAGQVHNLKEIGDKVSQGEIICKVGGQEVKAAIGGVIRGLIRTGISVPQGLKIGDIDPRGEVDHCFTISEKALAVGGGVLEGILRKFST